MWKLKEDVTIVLKRHGAIVTQETLARNQGLAELILDDPKYFASYGHNLVNTSGTPAEPPKDKNAVVIEVNVKKKADALKQSAPEQSPATASTSTGQKTGGMSLNVSEEKQQSKSTVSQQQNQSGAKASYRGRKRAA